MTIRSLSGIGFAVLMFVGVVLLTVFIARLQAQPEKAVMREVSIDLPGSSAAVKGVRMVVDPGGRGAGDLLEPQNITLHLIDGMALTLAGRSSSVICNGGEVNSVFVRRPMTPVPFQEAKADMLRTLDALHIPMDDGMKRTIKFWTGDVPGYGHGIIPQDWNTGIRTPFHNLLLDVQISADPTGGWYYLLIFGSAPGDICSDVNPAAQPTILPTAEPMRTISVAIMEALSKAKGIDTHVAPRGFCEVDALHPQELIITFPDDTSMKMTARSSHMMCFDGIVHGVFVRPKMETTSFKQAKADMLSTLAGLHIHPDKGMDAMMSNWPSDLVAADEGHGLFHNYQAALDERIHGAELTVRLCPDSDDRWYYLLIFSADKKTGAAILPASTQAGSSSVNHQ